MQPIYQIGLDVPTDVCSQLSVRPLFHVTAREQVQDCSGATTCSVSREMILRLQLQSFSAQKEH
jgi:hypothetical protein